MQGNKKHLSWKLVYYPEDLKQVQYTPGEQIPTVPKHLSLTEDTFNQKTSTIPLGEPGCSG